MGERALLRATTVSRTAACVLQVTMVSTAGMISMNAPPNHARTPALVKNLREVNITSASLSASVFLDSLAKHVTRTSTTACQTHARMVEVASTMSIHLFAIVGKDFSLLCVKKMWMSVPHHLVRIKVPAFRVKGTTFASVLLVLLTCLRVHAPRTRTNVHRSRAMVLDTA